VRGLEPAAARAAAAALETRLAELATEAGVPLVPRAEAFRRAPAVDVPAGSPAAVGEAAAGAVWSALAGRAGR
jgi:hypothetical protein